MTDFRDGEHRDVEVRRDENGMIIMPSERRTEPPPKTGGLAGIIFVAVVAVAGVGGYLWMQNAPPAEEYAVEQNDAPQPYAAPQPQQLAMNETPTTGSTTEAPVAPAPVQRRAAPRATAPPMVGNAPMPAPVPEAVPPFAPPPPVDMNAPPPGE